MKLFKRAGKTILKINKREWESIGINKKWTTSSVSYKNTMGITFSEGNILNFGKKGLLKIVKINLDDKIATLQGADGSSFLVDMDTLDTVIDIEQHKQKKMQKERAEEEARLTRVRESGEAYERRERNRRRMDQLFTTESRGFYLMGFIAANGILAAQVPADQIAQYEAMYRNIKGVSPTEGSYSVANPESKWSNQLRIHLPKSMVSPEIQSLFVNTFGFDIKETKTHYDINATEYVKRLMGLGFDIGRPNNQNVDVISKNIEDRYGSESKDQFESGFLNN